MDKRTNKIIKDYVAAAGKENTRLVKAYLFGSYAKKTDKPESDIDIALVIENLDDDEKFDFQVGLMLLALKFDSRIEPHPISNKDFNLSNSFVNEIKKNGIEIVPETQSV